MLTIKQLITHFIAPLSIKMSVVSCAILNSTIDTCCLSKTGLTKPTKNTWPDHGSLTAPL